jgi:hypothetical protein
MNSFNAVDDFLGATYGLRLEEVLCDGCLIGRVPAALSATARIMPTCRRAVTEDDGGEWSDYEGVLILDDIWYRFGCHIFVDANGQCFLADLSAFEAVEWKVRLAV